MFKQNMCETANQQYIWSHMVVYMVSKMMTLINFSTMLLAVFVIQK